MTTGPWTPFDTVLFSLFLWATPFVSLHLCGWL